MSFTICDVKFMDYAYCKENKEHINNNLILYKIFELDKFSTTIKTKNLQHL